MTTCTLLQVLHLLPAVQTPDIFLDLHWVLMMICVGVTKDIDLVVPQTLYLQYQLGNFVSWLADLWWRGQRSARIGSTNISHPLKISNTSKSSWPKQEEQ